MKLLTSNCFKIGAFQKNEKSSNLKTMFWLKTTLLKGILKILNRAHFTAIFANRQKRLVSAVLRCFREFFFQGGGGGRKP